MGFYRIAFSRPGAVSPEADPETTYKAMAEVDRAIVFTLRYGDSVDDLCDAKAGPGKLRINKPLLRRSQRPIVNEVPRPAGPTIGAHEVKWVK